MNTDDVLFETYKLQTELAERVATLRENLAKVYVSVIASVSGVIILLSRWYGFDTKVIDFLSLLGVVAGFSWLLSIASVTNRLSAKHEALLVLEQKLPFRFLEEEDRAFRGSLLARRKYTSAVMPVLLVLIFLWLYIYE